MVALRGHEEQILPTPVLLVPRGPPGIRDLEHDETS